MPIYTPSFNKGRTFLYICKTSFVFLLLEPIVLNFLVTIEHIFIFYSLILSFLWAMNALTKEAADSVRFVKQLSTRPTALVVSVNGDLWWTIV